MLDTYTASTLIGKNSAVSFRTFSVSIHLVKCIFLNAIPGFCIPFLYFQYYLKMPESAKGQLPKIIALPLRIKTNKFEF